MVGDQSFVHQGLELVALFLIQFLRQPSPYWCHCRHSLCHSSQRLLATHFDGLPSDLFSFPATSVVRSMRKPVTPLRLCAGSKEVPPSPVNSVHTHIFQSALVVQCGERSPVLPGELFIACAEPWWLSARFRTSTSSTGVDKSKVWSDERPLKWTAKWWRRRREVTVLGMASLLG